MNLLDEFIVIGEQTWMLRNLELTQFQNGIIIPEISANQDWENSGIEGNPACCFYNNKNENKVKYGGLYNWFAITDSRKIAPKGWRIPTCSDWDKLIAHLGGRNVAGKKLKSTGLWVEKENGENGNGSNESGFNALPSGQRNFIGQYNRINLSCCWWASSNDLDKTNWFYYLDHNSDKIKKGIADLEDGFSIRLIKEQ